MSNVSIGDRDKTDKDSQCKISPITFKDRAISADVVIKIGGSTLGQHDTTVADLVALQKSGRTPVVVHGGGKAITEWQGKLGINATFIRGLRVTDQTTLEMVVAVLAGVVNKSIVGEINAIGGNAVGISGADSRLLEARIADPELGLVGEVTHVRSDVVTALFDKGFMPVIAPLGYKLEGQKWTMLNINADTAASEIACAMKVKELIFTSDVPGIFDATGKVIPEVDRALASKLIADGTASKGMIPKIEACLKAAAAGTAAHIIDGRQSKALLDCLDGKAVGTIFKAER